MKQLLYILSSFTLLFSLCILSGCSDKNDLLENGNPEDAVEMQGVKLYMTRATGSEVAELTDYVGRKEFFDRDIAVFTTIKRTSSPISQFHYKDLQFVSNVTTAAGVTSVGWSRVPNSGTTVAATETSPDRIYWSDATNPHTFIGFCTPQQEEGFDWKKVNVADQDVYYGSLGDPTLTGEGNNTIDYRSNYNQETKEETLSGNLKICKDDILLTYSEAVKAEDAIARLRFHHGLAQVRVIANISDFAAGGDASSADKKTVISDVTLHNMLTMYKWTQHDSTTVQLEEADNTVLPQIYQSSVPAYNQKKDVLLWIPHPAGIGEGANKTFTFYALAVPTTILSASPLRISFKATYPDPMNPLITQTKNYEASISGITFSSGMCTTISISLNHQNEKITVGASYEDWDFEESPDQGALKKNSTFLASTARSDVYILGDEKATADDATWLYMKDGNVVDVYGNDGSEDKPFTISTAKQLLSFAYEVKGTGRVSNTANNNLTGGWDFSGKYVKLDADIHLQSVTNVDSITVNKKYVDKENVPLLNWIGIGDATTAFNGNFIGGGRNITHLYGKAFFSNIGGQATISEVTLSDVVRVTDHGALAEQNSGFIYACRVEGEVKSNNNIVGSLCGTNAGFIFACIHNGAVKGTSSVAKVGGLLGTNSGIIAVSYHTGAIEGSTKYGVVDEATTGSKIYACYYNSTLATPTSTVDSEHVQGRTLGQMQSKSFATTDLNDKIDAISSDNDLLSGLLDAQKTYFLSIINNYHFVFTPGAYPRVQKK